MKPRATKSQNSSGKELVASLRAYMYIQIERDVYWMCLNDVFCLNVFSIIDSHLCAGFATFAIV